MIAYLNDLSLGVSYPVCLRWAHAAGDDETAGNRVIMEIAYQRTAGWWEERVGGEWEERESGWEERVGGEGEWEGEWRGWEERVSGRRG